MLLSKDLLAFLLSYNVLLVFSAKLRFFYTPNGL